MSAATVGLGCYAAVTLIVDSLLRTVEPLFAVLLATAIVMVSLAIHIGARPFEDSGTDWTEMLTLTSQLFLLVAGPVFKTLVSGRRPRLHCAQPTAIGDARRMIPRTTCKVGLPRRSDADSRL